MRTDEIQPLPLDQAGDDFKCFEYPFRMYAAVGAGSCDSAGTTSAGGMLSLWHWCGVEQHQSEGDWAETLFQEREFPGVEVDGPGVYYVTGTVEVVICRQCDGGFESGVNSIKTCRRATVGELVALGLIRP